MPNIKGGKNYKRGKKSSEVNSGKKVKTPWVEDGDNYIYGFVEKKLGGNRIEAKCSDKQTRQVIIPGSFHKKIWINPQDVLLIQINDLNPKEGYILYKYNPDEIKELKHKGIDFDSDNRKRNLDIKFSNEKNISDNIDDNNDNNDNNSYENNNGNNSIENNIPFNSLSIHEKKLLKKEQDLNLNNDRNKKEKLINNEIVNNFNFDDI